MKTLLIALLFVAACGPSASKIKKTKESQRCQEICSKSAWVSVGVLLLKNMLRACVNLYETTTYCQIFS